MSAQIRKSTKMLFTITLNARNKLRQRYKRCEYKYLS